MQKDSRDTNTGNLQPTGECGETQAAETHVWERRSRERHSVGMALRRERRLTYEKRLRSLGRVTRIVACCVVLFVSGFYFGFRLGKDVTAEEVTSVGSVGSAGSVESVGSVGFAGVSRATGSAGVEDTAEPASSATELPPTGASLPADTGATVPGTAVVSATPSPSREELLSEIKWPADGRISRSPGWMYSEHISAWIYLSGVDIAVEPRSPVTAAMGGVVESVTVDPALGTVMVLDHQGGLETTYGRLASVEKSPGDSVAPGEVIGRSGPDAVYFKLSCDGEPLSPQEWLAKAK